MLLLKFKNTLSSGCICEKGKSPYLCRLHSPLIAFPRHRVGSVLYCGKTGSYKTYSAVEDALSWRSPIWHNFGPNGLRSPWGHKIFEFQDFAELKKARCATIIIDEAGEVLDSQMWASLDRDIRRCATQQRKLDWRLIMVSQSPDFVDKTFRTLAHTVVNCSGQTLPFPLPFANRKNLKCSCCNEVMIKGSVCPTLIVQQAIAFEEWQRLQEAEKVKNATMVEMALQSEKIKRIEFASPFVSNRYIFYDQKIADCYGSSALIDTSNFRK